MISVKGEREIVSTFIGNNIHSIRVNYGLTQAQLAKLTGISQTSISAWECGKSVPRLKSVKRIVAAFPDLDLDDLYSQSLGYSRRVLRSAAEGSDAHSLCAPLYGSIAAGKPIDMLESDSLHPIPGILAKRYPNAFFLKVQGESMNRKLPNGCYALVDPRVTEAVDGKVYAVCVGSLQATVKRVRMREGSIVLEPDSTDPSFEPQVFDGADEGQQTLSIIGQVVWYTVPYDFEI